MNVLHFVRKNTQLRASFIKNQIFNHIEFASSIVFREDRKISNDGGFADFSLDNIPYLDLSRNESLPEKFLFQTVKTLSNSQVRTIVSFIEKHKIDICQFHYGTDCGIYYPLLKKISIPSVVSFYGYDSSSFPKYLYGYGRRYLTSRVFNCASGILAMSPDMKQDLIESGCPEEKIIIHYHGVDCMKFKYQKEYPEKDNLRLLILASLVPKKGHIFLFRSLQKLVDSGINNFRLRVVGTGRMESDLKNYVLNNNLSDLIDFIGVVNYGSEEMFAEYYNADIFIHPSVIAPDGDKEGIPGTLVEAMSAGIPVLSTYHAGIPSVIESGKTGLLVKENDVDALAGSLIHLLQNRDMRRQLGLAGQEYALKYLDIKLKTKELAGIYSELIKDQL
jgi:colanic acid/amylovoran biosynthesis glycosyltransferase